MSELYNEQKLTPIFKVMKKKKVLIEGGGAIGSMGAELLTRNSTGLIAVSDFDDYEADNIPKSSTIIRYPEDIGINKAVALAKRLDAIANDGCKILGFPYDIKKIGPMALAPFDYVVLALDNEAMRIFAATILKLCPEEKRPILLSCGTSGECSESVIFSKKGACLRCTIPDEWLKNQDPETRWSCAEKVHYLLPQKVPSIVSTSGIAGMKAAIDIDDMITAHALGLKKFEQSTRRMESPYPIKGSSETTILPMDHCPLCEVTPPADVIRLPGCTAETTLREVLKSVAPFFPDGDFRLRVHTLVIPGVPEQIYNQFVFTNRCSVCGTIYPIMKHTGYSRKDQLICPHCQTSADTQEDSHTDFTFSFSLKETPDAILDMPLLELGYPIGGYYEAESFNAGSTDTEEDILFNGFDLEPTKNMVFYLADDEEYFIHEH